MTSGIAIHKYNLVVSGLRLLSAPPRRGSARSEVDGERYEVVSPTCPP